MYYMVVYWNKKEEYSETFNKFDDLPEETVLAKFEELNNDTHAEDVQLVIVLKSVKMSR